jgi:NAD(P)-dependent dehydrogenase (short-subunit alcohol dehydrogenase family)
MKIAVVTGAGSGVGRATALLLAREGWGVALVGRGVAALQETLRAIGAGGPLALALPCDVGDPAAVAAMAAAVAAQLGEEVEALINAAGVNTPARSLAALSLDDYHRIVETNMHGAYYCVQAFLPGMRQRGAGTIVNINSGSGLRASALAGTAYSMSKFGMAALTQNINAEERRHGVRACSIHPGDINTPLLDRRPSPPPPEARERMIQPEDVARCVLLAISLPPRAVVEEIVVTPGS